jgi:hypothetical protein
MAIWLNELDNKGAQAPQTADRQRLQLALARLYDARQQGQSPDCALVVLDAQARPEQGGNSAAMRLFQQALQQCGRTPFALRDGQYGLLVPVRGSQFELQQLLNGLKQALLQGEAERYPLLFGAAMASETKLGASGWLALADMRLQSRQSRLGLGAVAPRSREERRRQAATSTLAAGNRAIH